MTYQPQIRHQDGKEYILCVWRHKYVRLTPEEWVRQHVLHALVEDFGYPQNLIAVEAPINVGEVSKRCDAIVYDKALRAVCLVEFKAPTVALTQQVFDQVAVYNREVGVDYFIISNGKQHIACHVESNGYSILENLPLYEELWQKN